MYPLFFSVLVFSGCRLPGFHKHINHLLFSVLTICSCCNCFRMNCRKHHMVRIHNDDRSGAPTISGIYQYTVVLRFLQDSFDRRRFRTDDSDYSISIHSISEPYVEHIDRHSLIPLYSDTYDFFAFFCHTCFLKQFPTTTSTYAIAIAHAQANRIRPVMP